MAVLIMAPVDGSAVNIIIPVIQQDFHVAHLGRVAWVQLAYLIVIGGLILPMGRLGDLWGFRRIYLFGAALFTVSSALCGLAPSLGWLVGARVLQAVGACMTDGAEFRASSRRSFPPRSAAGRWASSGCASPSGWSSARPSAGSSRTCEGSWRWVFFINLPIGLFGGLWCARMLPPLRLGRAARVDWLGGLLAVTMLTALLLAITHGQSVGLGLARRAGSAGAVADERDRLHPGRSGAIRRRCWTFPFSATASSPGRTWPR